MRLIAACLAGLLIASAAHSDDGLAQVYRKQCDNGDAFYCQAYGVMLSEGRGVPVDKTMATVYLGKACDADAAVACRYLADLYTAPDGVRKDPELAAALYKRACDLHDTESCAKLSQIRSTDASVSLTQLERDCEAGKAQACIDAGDLERDAKNGATMISLYGKACALNDGRGCYHVGYSYHFGNQVPQDERRAIAAYEKGCALGNKGSCIMVKSAQH